MRKNKSAPNRGAWNERGNPQTFPAINGCPASRAHGRRYLAQLDLISSARHQEAPSAAPEGQGENSPGQRSAATAALGNQPPKFYPSPPFPRCRPSGRHRGKGGEGDIHGCSVTQGGAALALGYSLIVPDGTSVWLAPLARRTRMNRYHGQRSPNHAANRSQRYPQPTPERYSKATRLECQRADCPRPSAFSHNARLAIGVNQTTRVARPPADGMTRSKEGAARAGSPLFGTRR